METGLWCAHRRDLYPFGSVSLSAGTNSILSGFSPVFAQENPADTRPVRVFGQQQVTGSTSQPMAVILDLFWTQVLQATGAGVPERNYYRLTEQRH
jgi:hypothetical protein